MRKRPIADHYRVVIEVQGNLGERYTESSVLFLQGCSKSAMASKLEVKGILFLFPFFLLKEGLGGKKKAPGSFHLCPWTLKDEGAPLPGAAARGECPAQPH